MHYCVLLITKELPKRSGIDRIMKKYTWDNVNEDEDGNVIGEMPLFTHDYYVIGGRYAGSLKLKIDEKDDKYSWKYYAKEERNGRLFHSYLLNEMKEFAKSKLSLLYSEEKYFSSMGSRDDFLYVDGAKISDLLNFDKQECYICIDKDGNAIAREHWDGKGFVKDNKFDEKLEDIKANSKDCYATILDIHD